MTRSLRYLGRDLLHLLGLLRLAAHTLCCPRRHHVRAYGTWNCMR
jgi:hypothetical protein